MNYTGRSRNQYPHTPPTGELLGMLPPLFSDLGCQRVAVTTLFIHLIHLQLWQQQILSQTEQTS